MGSVSKQKTKHTTVSVGKRMIVTGPDYIKDYLPKIHEHNSYIGENLPSLEKTGDLRYLYRSASNICFPAKHKHEYVGEIGWGIPEYDFINKSRLESGFHIKYNEPTLAAITQVSHRYQNPWQPKPCVLDKQRKFSRAFIAWNMSDYEDTDKRKSKNSLLLKENKEELSRGSLLNKLYKYRKEGKKVTIKSEK